jgi:hypothetical protein
MNIPLDEAITWSGREKEREEWRWRVGGGQGKKN